MPSADSAAGRNHPLQGRGGCHITLTPGTGHMPVPRPLRPSAVAPFPHSAGLEVQGPPGPGWREEGVAMPGQHGEGCCGSQRRKSRMELRPGRVTAVLRLAPRARLPQILF